MEAQYKNDMFVSTLVNPNATLLDYASSGLTSENTNLLTPEEYKQTKFVKEKFTENGVFNDQVFNNAYALAAQKYQDLVDDNMSDKLANYIAYNSSSRFAEADKIRDDQPEIKKVSNPFDTKLGITGLFEETESNKSLRELAQMNTHYFDWDKQQWVEESPDQFGLSSLWRDTMVYAQWDEDGTHVDLMTNQVVSHKKGEWKTDNNGKFYLETLGHRESYDKQVVSALDTLVSENSAMQSIAFWESDEKEKSVMGTTMKLIAQIAPYFIPGFNTYWGGLHMAWGLASVLPTFYKSFESAILGKDHTDLWKGANQAENWFAKFEPSISEESQDSFWNYEQMSKMIGDVFAQIYEQRAAAKMASKLLGAEKKAMGSIDEMVSKHKDDYVDFIIQTGGKPTPEQTQIFFQTLYENTPEFVKLAKKERQLAKAASLGYMALTQSVDVYGDALKAGYDERAAGITALVAAGGQYGLMMNNRLGDWFMRGIFGYDEQGVQKQINKALRPYLPALQKAVNDVDNAITKGAKQSAKSRLAGIVTSMKNGLKESGETIKYGTEDFWGRAGIEAVEEVTEEAAIDMAKGVTDTLSWLGVWEKNGDFYDEEHPFLSKETLNRYLTSAVGGFVGGALFEFNDRFINQKINGQMSYADQRNFLQLIADGHAQEMIDTVYDYFKHHGNNKQAMTPLTINTESGTKTVYPTTTAETSQAEVMSNVLINYIKWADGIMNQEGLKEDEQSVLKKALINTQLIKLFKDSGLENYVIEEFTNATQNIINTIGEIQKLGDKVVSKELEEKLNKNREAISNIVNGKNQEKYIELASFVLNPDIKQAFNDMDIFSFTEYKYGKKYGELSKEEQTNINSEYDDFVKSKDYKAFLDIKLKAFEKLSGKISPAIKKLIDSFYPKVRQNTINTLFNTIDYNTVLKSIKANLNQGLLDEIYNIGITSNPSKKGIYDKLRQNINTVIDTNGDILSALQNFYSEIAVTPEITNKVKPLYDELIKYINDYKQILFDLHKKSIYANKEGINFDELISKNLFKYLDNLLPKSVKEQYLEIVELNDTSLTPEQIEQDAQDLTNRIEQIINQYVEAYPVANYNLEYLQKVINSAKQDVVDLANKAKVQLTQLQNAKLTAEAEGKSIEEIDRQINSIKLLTNLDGISFNPQITDDIDLYRESIIDYLLESNVIDGDILDKFETYYFNQELTKFTSKFEIAYGLNLSDTEKQEITNSIKERLNTSNFVIQTLESQLLKQYREQTIQKILSLSKEIPDGFLIYELNNTSNDIFGVDFNKLSTYDDQVKCLHQLIENGISFDFMLEQEINLYKRAENLFIKDSALSLNDFDTDLIAKANEIYSKPRVENALYKLLNQLQLYFGQASEKTIFDILMQAKMDINKLEASQFRLSQVNIDAVDKAIETVKMVEAVIYAMIETDISLQTPFGFNSAIKHYLEKYENGIGADNYIVMDYDTATPILHDLNRLKERLQFIKDFSGFNGFSQIGSQIRSREAFNRVIQKQFADAAKRADTIFIEKDILPTILNTELPDDDKVFKCEQGLYKNFQELSKKLGKKDALIKLFKEFNIKIDKDFAFRKSNGIDENTKEISNYDLAVYLTTIIGLDPSKFQYKYLQLLREEQAKTINQKAPLFGQEYAIRVGMAMYESQELFDYLYDLLPQESKERFQKGSRNYYLSAIGGAGKTSTIANYMFNMILPKGEKANVEFYAPSIRARQHLIKSILGDRVDELSKNLTGKEEGLNKKELLGRFVENADEVLAEIEKSENDEKFTNGTYVTKQGEKFILTDSVKLITDNVPDILFLDESTNLETPIFEILHKVSQATKMRIYAYGDNAQLGKFQSVDEIFTINPPILKLSLRDSNNIKKENNEKIHNILSILITNNDLTDNNNVEKSIKDSNFKLKYSQNDTQIVGEKVVTSIPSDALNIIAKNMSNDESVTLAVIVEKGSEISSELKDALETAGISKYEVYSIDPDADNAVQGAEATYAISDKLSFTKGKYSETFLSFKKFYTTISRSFNATILYDPDENILKAFNLASTSELSFNIVECLSEDVKKQELGRRIEVLERLVGSYIPTEEKKKEEVKSEEDEKIDSAVKEYISNEKKIEEDLPEEFDDAPMAEKEIETPQELTEIPDEIKTPESVTNKELKITPLYVYPFYTRLGRGSITLEGFEPLSDAKEEINVIPASDGKYNKSDILDFILLKNALSLYSKNGLKRVLQNDMYQSLLRKLGWDTDLNSSIDKIGNVKLIASLYDPNIDSPYQAFNFGSKKELNKGDVFLRLVRSVKVNGETYNITIAVLPNVTTITDVHTPVTDDTKTSYENLCRKLKTDLENKARNTSSHVEIEIESGINFEDSNNDYLAGIQVNANLRYKPAENGLGISLDQFAEHGLWYSGSEIFLDPDPKLNTSTVSTSDRQTIYEMFLQNAAEAAVRREGKTDDQYNKAIEEYKDELHKKLDNGRALRGRPIVQTYLTPDYKLSLTLKPKSREFNTVLDELTGLVGKRKNTILSKYDAVKFYMDLHAKLKPAYFDAFRISLIRKTRYLIKNHKGVAFKNQVQVWEDLIAFLENEKVLENTSSKISDIFNEIGTKNSFLGTFGYELFDHIKLLKSKDFIALEGKKGGIQSSDIAKNISNEFEKKQFYYGRAITGKSEYYQFDTEINSKNYITNLDVEMPIITIDFSKMLSNQTEIKEVKKETQPQNSRSDAIKSVLLGKVASSEDKEIIKNFFENSSIEELIKIGAIELNGNKIEGYNEYILQNYPFGNKIIDILDNIC